MVTPLAVCNACGRAFRAVPDDRRLCAKCEAEACRELVYAFVILAAIVVCIVLLSKGGPR